MAQDTTNTGYRKNTSGNPTKQVPIVVNKALVRKAITPSAEVIYNRPDHVLINTTGSYAFLYSTTGSVGGNAPNLHASTAGAGGSAGKTGYITGSVIRVGGVAAPGYVQPVKLNINPVAWSRVDASTSRTGDITFIYAGKFVPEGGPR
tara:strand:- start:5 stop:448 length:444 start_codon:yes stop_codon:yes gene_type:complete